MKCEFCGKESYTTDVQVYTIGGIARYIACVSCSNRIDMQAEELDNELKINLRNRIKDMKLNN